MGAGGAGRGAGRDRVYPLRGILRDVHDRQCPTRRAGVLPARRVAVGHGGAADAVLRRRRGGRVGVQAAFLGRASARPDRADDLQSGGRHRGGHHRRGMGREPTRLRANYAGGLRDWRFEHVVRQGWRGVGPVELCDRHAGQDGPGHRTPHRRRKSVGLARLLSAVRQLRLGRRGGRRHQPGRQRDRDAGGRHGRVRVDDRLHVLPPGPPRAVG